MSRLRNSYFYFFLSCLLFSNLNPSINFGSKDSAFKFADNTRLSVSKQLSVNTGTIKKNTLATFSGAPIVFNNGILELDSSGVSLTGTCNFDNDYSIVLTGNGDIFRAEPGSITQKIFVCGSNNWIEGQPSFQRADAIKLQDLNTTVTLAVHNVLNSNIVLNNGTLCLAHNLRLGENISLTGSGTIKCYGCSIGMGGLALEWPAGIVDWKETPIIELTGNVALHGQWNFGSDGYIIGNGNVLDIADGKLHIGSGVSLYLTNVKLHGLVNNNLEFTDSTSQLYIRGVDIEMEDDCTFDTGGIYVDGTSTIITKDYILAFDLGSSLTVDGCVLWCESLSGSNHNNNIQPDGSADPYHARLTLIDGGEIKRMRTADVGTKVLGGNLLRYVMFENRVHELLDGDRALSPGHGYIATEDVVYDGDLHTLKFVNSASSSEPLITVAAGKTLLFENITIDGFSFDRISLGDGAQIVFGDKTRVVFTDQSINLTTTMRFQGDASLDGNSYSVLTFASDDAKILIDTQSSLLLQNIVMKNMSAYQLGCLDNTGTISFSGNVAWYLDDKYSFTVGHFEIMPASVLDVRGTYSFDYRSSKQSIIENTGTLKLSGSTFYYDPITDNRDLIKFGGSDAVMQLEGGTLASTTTGIHLTVGQLKIVGEQNYVVSGEAANSLSDAIWLGDGSNEENNFEFKFEKNGVLYLSMTRGVMLYSDVGYPDGRGTVINDGKIVAIMPATIDLLHPWRNGMVLAMNQLALFKLVLKPDTGTRMALRFDDSSGKNMFFKGIGSGISDSKGNSITFNGEFNTWAGIITPDPGSLVTLFGGLGDFFLATDQSEFIGQLPACRDVFGTISPVGFMVADPSYVVYLSLDNSESSINLNGGKVVLHKGIKFSDTSCFVNSGTVDANGKSVVFGGADLTWVSDIVWQSANNIQLNGKNTLACTWYFDGDAHISGNGDFLDLSDGGILYIHPNTSLMLTNLKLKGLGSGNIIFGDSTSELRLANVEIEMDDDYTFTTGGVYMSGASTIVTKNNLLTFDLASSLTVDGCTLWYDPLENDDNSNIRPEQSDDPHQLHLTFLHDGAIKRARAASVGTRVLGRNEGFRRKVQRNLVNDNHDSARYVTLENRRHPLSTDDGTISPGKGYRVTDDVVFDGDSKNLIFGNSSASDSSLITVDAGKTIVFENVTLEGFSFDRVSLGVGSHMIFGDKTRVVITDPLFNLTTTMTFQGEAKLEGARDAVLKLDSSVAGILVDRESSLLLQNITIKDISNNQLCCLDDTGTISFGGKVTFYLDNTYDFTVGHFEIMSASMLDVRGSYSFDYHTDKQSSIYNTGTLQLSDDATFNYAPISADNDLILFNGYESTLALNGGTLASTTTGIHLTVGQLKVIGENNFIAGDRAFSLSEGIQIGDGVDSENNFEFKFEKNGTVCFLLNPGLVVWKNCGAVGVRGTVVDGNILFKNQTEETRTLDEQFGFKNFGTIVFPRPVTEPNPRTRMDFDVGIMGGNPVTFAGDDAKLVDKNGNYIRFNGTYNSSTQHITPDQDSVVIQHGGLGYTIDAPAGCEIMGELLVGANPIGGVCPTGLTLTDPSGIVYLSLDNSQAHIDLNGGKVVFNRSMKFSDKAKFLNAGTVDLNGRSLALGGTDVTWDNAIRWQNANDIVLNSKLTLDTQWYFDGDSRISGNGNVLDLTDGGTLWIRPNTTLALTNLKLKGLGTGFVVFDDTTSQLYLSNVEIEMDDDYTFTTGGIYVEGPTNVVVKDHLLTFDQHASMSLDGVALTYNSMNFDDNNNIRPLPINDVHQTHIAYLHHGAIQSLKYVDRTTSNAISYLYSGTANLSDYLNLNMRQVATNTGDPYEVTIDDATYVLNSDLMLAENMLVKANATCTFDGGGHTIYFARGVSNVFQVAANKTVTFQNVTLSGYSEDAFTLVNGAVITFGDGVYIDLATSIALTRDWTVAGSTQINGNGNSLDLGVSVIKVQGASTLTVNGAILEGVKESNLYCDDSAGVVTVRNTTLAMSDDYAFETGAMNFEKGAVITGGVIFTYATNQVSMIDYNSTLVIDHDTTFRYAPTESDDRDLLVMVDDTSKLFLNGCTLSSTTTGLRLTGGTLLVDHKVAVAADEGGATLSEAITFGNDDLNDNLSIIMLPGASINVISGCLDYANRS